MAGICVSAITVLKLYHGTEFNWINDEFLSRVDRVEKWGGECRGAETQRREAATEGGAARKPSQENEKFSP